MPTVREFQTTAKTFCTRDEILDTKIELLQMLIELWVHSTLSVRGYFRPARKRASCQGQEYFEPKILLFSTLDTLLILRSVTLKDTKKYVQPK